MARRPRRGDGRTFSVRFSFDMRGVVNHCFIHSPLSLVSIRHAHSIEDMHTPGNYTSTNFADTLDKHPDEYLGTLFCGACIEYIWDLVSTLYSRRLAQFWPGHVRFRGSFAVFVGNAAAQPTALYRGQRRGSFHVHNDQGQLSRVWHNSHRVAIIAAWLALLC